jgi:hypothetical protein
MSLYCQGRSAPATLRSTVRGEQRLYTVRGDTSDFAFYSVGESHIPVLSGAATNDFTFYIQGGATSLYCQGGHQRLCVLQCGGEPYPCTVRGGTSDFTFYSVGESHVSILSGAAPATFSSTVRGIAMSLYFQG